LSVARQFGLPPFSRPQRILDPLTVRLGPGRIILLIGPSGSGKSTVLRLVADRCPRAHFVDRTRFPTGRPIIDAIGPRRPLPEVLKVMTACGLGEAHLWMRTINELSDGQRFRARLARAVASLARTNKTTPILCDEFCSGLHRRLARSIAFNLRKLATGRNLCLLLAAGNDDIAADLQPDTTVRLFGRGRFTIEDNVPRRKQISFARRLEIGRGCKRDYDEFAAMHYRTTDELGFVDKVFVLREGPKGELLGIVVYSHPPLELALRNQATKGRFTRRPKHLNEQMRILRRLVIHPDVRGCGLGHRLVRKTLPKVGTRFVECLASMGEVNPVFEKAGMKRIGTCAEPPSRVRILDELKALDVDPYAREFVAIVARRPRVRRLVAQLVYQWYQATTGSGEQRVARQSPQFLAQTFRGLIGVRPVYFLWCRPVRRNSMVPTARGPKRIRSPKTTGKTSNV
jgi:ABC-type thiamine transport system ATPase subunit